MHIEHVEDTLIEQKIVHGHEAYDLYRAVFENDTRNGRDWNPRIAYRNPGLYQLYHDEYIYDIVRKIQEINRRRRNYLLLWDWMKRRPW